MKYGEYLKAHLTSEWSSQYIFYEDLKEILYDLIKTNQTDEEFFQFCEKEASKINTFFAEKLAESILRFEFLKTELDFIEKSINKRHFSFSRLPNSNRKLKRHRYKKLSDLKLAFSEFYLMLILLKNYQTLNYTGFCKILKKHDKLFHTNQGDQWRLEYVDCTPFSKSIRVDQLMTEVEDLYINILENGNRTKAMQRLRLPPLEEKQSSIVTFRLGIFLGMICILIPLTIILFLTNISKGFNWQVCLHLYRSLFLLIIEIIFFGLNVYGWSKHGVNHVLIFEINPRQHLTYQNILELGTFLLVCYFLSLNFYMILFNFNFNPNFQPLILILVFILFLINPMKRFARHSRYWLIKKIYRVLTSPFHYVEFSDFWLGDQLCSLELIFFDIEYYFCFYLNQSSAIACSDWLEVLIQSILQNLPSWYRFTQCIRRYYVKKEKFPHLVNAGKYASTFFVSLTNALRRAKSFDYHQNKYENPFVYLWMIFSLISSTYKFIWDIRMDWGLGNLKQKEHFFLREQLIYPNKSFYYLAILFNFLFRYIWIINIFLHFNSLFAEYSDIIGFSFAFIELIRRFIWNFFRLENEHLNNCGQFRAVRDISIRPENSSLNQSITSQIQMRTLNRENTLTNRSFSRKKTNAEEFLDEIDTVLTIQPNLQISTDDSLL